MFCRKLRVLSSDFSFILADRPSIFKRSLSFYGIMSNSEVKHDTQAGYFFINLGKGVDIIQEPLCKKGLLATTDKDMYLFLTDKAVLEYEKEGQNTLNMWHTEVPVSHIGQGLGAHLAKAALDHAVENNLQVKPTCSYIQKYLKDNPLPQYTERILPANQ